MADHLLKPAIDRRLGRPLPYQLPNLTRVHPSAINLSSPRNQSSGAYTVLAVVSNGCSVLKGRSPRVTHPCATHPRTEVRFSVRLACVRHAASVRSEPGSNSQVNLTSLMSHRFATQGQNPNHQSNKQHQKVSAQTSPTPLEVNNIKLDAHPLRVNNVCSRKPLPTSLFPPTMSKNKI